MTPSRAGLRLAVLLLFLVGVLSPVAATGAAAQSDLTCDDFNSERAAQAVLDADPDLEDVLDPDGNGIACDHENGEEPDSGRQGTGGDDAEGYVADAIDLADSWAASLDELIDLDPLGPNFDSNTVEDVQAVLEALLAAPDEAAALEAPEGAEDVQFALEDLADAYAGVTEAFLDWADTPAGSPEEADAEDAYFDAIDEALAVAADFEDAVAGFEPGPGPDNGPVSGGDGDAYLEDVTAEAADWADALDELLAFEDPDAALDIAELFLDAPEIAAEFEAPEGFEDVQFAFEDLADGYADVGEAFLALADTREGSRAETRALTALEDAAAVVDELAADFEDAVAAAGGSQTGTNGQAGGDYVEQASAAAAEWFDALEALEAIDPTGLGLSEDEIAEVESILTLFLEAPAVAAGLEPGAGLEDLHVAFEDLADAYEDVANTLLDWVETEQGSVEEADAEDAYLDALDEAFDLADEFETLLGDAGSGETPSNNGRQDVDADVAAYLDDVNAHATELMAGIDTFFRILEAAEFTDDDIVQIQDTLTLWGEAPDVAAELEAPAGLEDVHDLYLELADAYAGIVDNFDTWLAAESGSRASDTAWEAVIDSMLQAIEIHGELEQVLADAGA